MGAYQRLRVVRPAVAPSHPATDESEGPARSTALLVQLYQATRASLRPETRRVDASVYREYADAFPALPTRPDQLAAFLMEQQGEHAGTTYWNKYGKWRRFHEWAHEAHGAPNPFAGLTAPRKPRTVPFPLEDHEAQRVWALAWQSGNAEWIALAMLLLGTGARIGEIARIRRSHVMRDVVIIPDGKTGGREIPIPHPRFAEVVAALGRGDLLWVTPGGAPRSVQGLTQTWRHICGRVGIYGRKAGPHAARHRFALVLLARSGDIRVVQWGLGHESLSSTLVYIRLRPRHVLDQWAKLSPLAGFEAGSVRAPSKKRLPREDVLTAIRNDGGWVSPADLARRLGRPSGTVNRLLWCMARDGELVSDGAGKYALRRLAA